MVADPPPLKGEWPCGRALCNSTDGTFTVHNAPRLLLFINKLSTIPWQHYHAVTTASAERRFSTLRWLKSYLRPTMTDVSMALANMHQYIPVTYMWWSPGSKSQGQKSQTLSTTCWSVNRVTTGFMGGDYRGTGVNSPKNSRWRIKYLISPNILKAPTG
jgi:hypothetical protein